MRKAVFLGMLVLSVAALGLAGDAKTWNGYLVDKMCGKPERAAGHTKSCTEKCAGSGLGVVADGKFLPFDEKGNQLAADFLKETKQVKGVKILVEGMQEGELIKVTSLKDAE